LAFPFISTSLACFGRLFKAPLSGISGRFMAIAEASSALAVVAKLANLR
jgi:hypothetical protein